MKRTVFTLGFCLFSMLIYAQDSLLYRDPVANFRHSYSIALAEGVSMVNTNYPSIIYHGTPYIAVAGQYSSSAEGIFDWGLIYKLSSPKKPTTEDGFFLVNFGFTIKDLDAIVTDSNNNRLKLSQEFITVPVSIGFRTPLNVVKAHLRFHAIEWKAGVYYSLLIDDHIGQVYDYDNYTDHAAKNYSNFGLFGELSLSFLDKRGHGHVFGLRAEADFSGSYLGAGKDLPPVYESTTLYYNLENYYRK